jgi:hypothetical protein
MPVPVAMVSSTVLDLPEHRAKVCDACLVAEFFPSMMESLAARDEHPITTSLQMVDKAEVLVGIYGWRYGYVPSGHVVSITEMELKHAEDTRKPVFGFIAHDSHEGVASRVELAGEAQERLARLKEHVAAAHTVKFFASAEQLKYDVTVALLQRRIEQMSTDRQAINFVKLAQEEEEKASQARKGMLGRMRDRVMALVAP